MNAALAIYLKNSEIQLSSTIVSNVDSLNIWLCILKETYLILLLVVCHDLMIHNQVICFAK